MLAINSTSRLRFSVRLHWPWIAGCILLAWAAALSMGDIPALRREERALERELQALQAQLRTPVVATTSGQSQDLRTALATLANLDIVTADMQTLASKHGVDLGEASYTHAGDTAGGRIGRVAIHARLKGAYPSMKKTLAELLALHQGLALESVSLRRNRAADAVLEIELRFTFFYRIEAP